MLQFIKYSVDWNGKVSVDHYSNKVIIIKHMFYGND